MNGEKHLRDGLVVQNSKSTFTTCPDEVRSTLTVMCKQLMYALVMAIGMLVCFPLRLNKKKKCSLKYEYKIFMQ